MSGKLLFTCYDLEILDNNHDGISNFNAQIRKHGRYLINGFSEFQCQIIDLFWQKKIKPARGNYQWHEDFFYQSDLMWQNKDILYSSLQDWLAVRQYPIIKYLKTDKLSVIQDLDLISEINTPLNRIDEKKTFNLALASFICQESGIIMIKKLHHIKMNKLFASLWEKFARQTSCALVFLDQKPAILNLDISEIF